MTERLAIPHNVATVVVSCAAGNCFPIELRNLGWSEVDGGYVTEFVFQGGVYRSVFDAAFHVPQHCATPELRLAHDENFLFDELGLAVVDLEVTT